jgi:hypothetical protein
VFLLRSVFSIGSQLIEPLISMDKNFVRVDILIPVNESSFDKKLNMASIRLHMPLIDDMIYSFHISIRNLDRLPNIQGTETQSHVRAIRIIGGSL